MKRMSPEARVGLLVLAGLLILVYMSLKVGKLGLGPGGGYRVEVELGNAVGLVKDGEVMVAGIPVGVIEAIRLDHGKALLSLRIRDEVKLPADSLAVIRTKGVLGERYVAIEPGTSSRNLADGDRLRAGPPPGDLDRLVSKFNTISTDVQRITERWARVFGTDQGEQDLRDILEGFRDAAVGLREVVRENRETLRTSLAQLGGLAEDLRGVVRENREALGSSLENTRRFTQVLADRTPAITGNLESLTADLDEVVAENRENLAQSLANLRVATAKFSTTLDSVRNLAEAAGSPRGTLGKLIHDDALYEDLRGSLGDLRAVLERLQRGEGTLGKLLTDDSAYAELNDSLENLRTITDKINRGEGTIGKLVNDESVHKNLNQTLEGITDFVGGANRFQFELGYQGEYLAELGEAKNYFSLELRPRQDRFYYVALVDDPRGDQETETTEREVTDATGTHTVTERKTVTRDRLKFSAQVGKRFSFLTVRGGIFESAGGVGADLDFWSDRLRLTFEAFDFARDQGPPHLKLSARWRFLKHLFVTAGLDDFIDDRGRSDYFVGGGIRFLDEDVKFLLSPAANLAR